jgi:hypothetical protein
MNLPIDELRRIIGKIEVLFSICYSVKLEIIQAKDTQQTLASLITYSFVNSLYL